MAHIRYFTLVLLLISYTLIFPYYYFSSEDEQKEVDQLLIAAEVDISHLGKPDFQSQRPAWGQSDLELAAEYKLGLTKEMPRQVMLDGQLCSAAYDGDFTKAQTLLKTGANPNIIAEFGITAFMDAVRGNHRDIVQLFLEHNVMIDAQSSFNGYNALMLAAMNRNVELIQILLNAGADTTLKSHEGKSYLDYLIESIIPKHTNTVNQLIKKVLS